MKTLTKEDFLAYVPLSKNITDAQLAPHIQDAKLMDLTPQLGDLADRLLLETAPEDDPFTPDEEKARVAMTPVWVLNAFMRFLPQHGISITLTGFTKSRDSENTFEHASAQERREFMQPYRSKLSYWEGELGKALKVLNGTGRPTGKRSRVGLRVVGAR